MPDQIDILTLDRHWTDGEKLSRFFHFKHNDISAKYRELKQRENRFVVNYLDMHGRLFRNNNIADVLMYDLRSTIYDLRSTIYDLRSTIYDLRSTIYDLRSTIYDLRSTIYDLRHRS